MRTPWLSTTPSFVVIAIVALVTMTSCQQNDDTLKPHAKGHDVVETTLERLSMLCVFPDDKLLMRRIAYIESADGASPDTFREGYYGGIWQVDQDMFEATQSASALVVMSQAFQDIKKTLSIDWSTAVWKDLVKPLYSALGAQIYIQYNSRNDAKGIPRDIPDQALFWKKYYRPNGDADKFKVAALRLEEGCHNNVGADIVFVLDESGSVGSTNFASVKKFVKEVISAFDVAPDKNRFGVITYSSSPKRDFDLNKYSNLKDVLKAVDNIKYGGGGTKTHLALDEMRTKSFTEKYGARPLVDGHPRIAIIMTDGESESPSETIKAALRVQDADITAFAIGVGSKVNLKELDAIASDPDCIHRFLLKDFSEIDALKYAIEKRTCEAPVIISPSQNSTSGRLPPGWEQNCKIKVQKDGATLQMLATSGSVTFYTARSTYPSAEYYEQKVVSVHGSPGIIFVPQPPTVDVEGLVYCSIKGDNGTETNVSIGLKPGDITACKSSPCKNGATCVNLINDFRCECPPGLTGKTCETDIDECQSNPCVNGKCNDGKAGWTCDCDEGFAGKTCESEIDECESSPCVTGTCIDQENGFQCKCEPGFTGVFCEKPLDHCSSNPCINGKCKPVAHGYECCCDPGFNGAHCEKEIDECKSNPCVRGDCVDHTNKYECRCPPGFTGVHCEKEIDECHSNPCVHGDCNDLVNGFECSCQPGWTGTHCEVDIDECESDPCQNGDCSDGVNRYDCDCFAGWTGRNCEIDIDECESSPCVHGQCIDKVNGYRCYCKPGWTGTHCETDIDECASHPCIHGRCSDQINHYTCTCKPGYTGTNCEKEINECASNPCVNGECKDHVNGFGCICNSGWTGVHCEIDIDECESSPCEHGKCKDKVNGYVCECENGWQGTHCDCVTNNCEKHPCKNGICENLIGGFNCICMHGFTGKTCESALPSEVPKHYAFDKSTAEEYRERQQRRLQLRRPLYSRQAERRRQRSDLFSRR